MNCIRLKKYKFSFFAAAAGVLFLLIRYLTAPVLLCDVTLPEPGEKNRVNVLLEIKGYRSRNLRLKKSGVFISAGDVRVFPEGTGADVIIDDSSVIELSSERRRKWWVSYTAEFGMLDIRRDGRILHGRHGHQGWLDGNSALLKGGNIFLFPDLGRIRNVKIKIHTDRDWDVFTTWGHDINFFGKMASEGLLEKALSDSVIGMGKFHAFKKIISDCDFRVFIDQTGRSRSDAVKIYNRLAAIFKFQIEKTGTKKIPAYTCLIFPWLDGERDDIYFPSDSAKILGWNNSFGQGLSIDPGNKRDFELFAHRLQHAISRDKPSGMRISRKEDSWYYEALAAYFEVISLRNAEIVEDLSRFRDFYYNTYLYLTFSDPEYNVPVSFHPEDSETVQDFLHYVKSPVVFLFMDAYLAGAAKGGISAETFLRYQIKRYSGGRDFMKVGDD